MSEPTVTAKAEITVTIGTQIHVLTVAEAEKLKQRLDFAIRQVKPAYSDWGR